MSIEEIKNKYMGMAEYASIRLGTTLDSMCCTVEEVGKLFQEIDRLTKELNDHKTMLSAHKLRERQLVEENAKHGLRYKMLQDKWAKENQGR